jgi:hypothetical protein
MGLKEVLHRMKIVELTEHDAPAASPSAGSAPPDLEAILAAVPAPRPIDERALARGAGEAGSAHPAGAEDPLEIPDFAAIYRAAGIADPPHGYTAFKVLEILSSPELAQLDPKSKAAALSGFLKMNPAGPVPIADLVQDAVRRDQALDQFEEFLRGRLGERSAEVERQNAALQAEIDELSRRHREKMDANRQALEAEQARLGRWQAAKAAEERKLFEAVAPFVDRNPVSSGEAPTSARPRETQSEA